MKIKEYIDNLKIIFNIISVRRKIQIYYFPLLVLVGAIAEIASIGAIFPFLTVLVDPEKITNNEIIRSTINIFGFDLEGDVPRKITLAFSVIVVVSSILRMALVYFTAKLNYGIGHEIGVAVFRVTLYRGYEYHVERNSSETIGALHKVDEVVWAIFMLLNMISAIVMACGILLTLLFINIVFSIFSVSTLIAIYALVFLFVRRTLAKDGEIVSQSINSRVQIIQEGLGCIRDILLDQSQAVVIKKFARVDFSMRNAQARLNIIAPSPRFAVEGAGMVLVAILAYSLAVGGEGLALGVPALGALALGAQRLMPLIQQIYHGWVVVSSKRNVLIDIVNILKGPVVCEALEKISPLNFERDIYLDGITFQYKEILPIIIDNISLRIKKGDRVGIVGPSGCGKTTLIDIVMGLLQPTAGRILVDGVILDTLNRFEWQRNIAHVPQDIYIVDGTMAENIALGVPPKDIDPERLRQVANLAQLSLVIERHPDGYDASVGERGIRLSGGQRQRLGIARALYRGANILIFDEATSALDEAAEEAVVQGLRSIDRQLTLFIVTHRNATLRDCNYVIELDNGRIKRVTKRGEAS